MASKSLHMNACDAWPVGVARRFEALGEVRKSQYDKAIGVVVDAQSEFSGGGDEATIGWIPLRERSWAWPKAQSPEFSVFWGEAESSAIKAVSPAAFP